MPESNVNDVVYRIDRTNRIISTNREWDYFARENGSPDLTAEFVINRPLLDFIHDEETRYLHNLLLDRIRASEQQLDLPFRCDSPELKRFMSMRIVPLDNNEIEYCCRTLRTEAQEGIHFTVAVETDQLFLRMCSWCKRIECESGNWLEVNEAILALELFSQPEPPPITHVMCEVCFADLMEKFPE